MGDNAITNVVKDTLWFLRKGENVKTAETKNNTIGAGTGIVSMTGTAHELAKNASKIDKVNNALASSNAEAVKSIFSNSNLGNTVKNITGACSDLTTACMYTNSAYNVLSDEDSKAKAGVEEGSSLLGMHLTEGMLQPKILQAVEGVHTSSARGAVIKAAATAVLCVGASLLGSIGGKAIGKTVTGRN